MISSPVLFESEARCHATNTRKRLKEDGRAFLMNKRIFLSSPHGLELHSSVALLSRFHCQVVDVQQSCKYHPCTHDSTHTTDSTTYQDQIPLIVPIPLVKKNCTSLPFIFQTSIICQEFIVDPI